MNTVPKCNSHEKLNKDVSDFKDYVLTKTQVMDVSIKKCN